MENIKFLTSESKIKSYVSQEEEMVDDIITTEMLKIHSIGNADGWSEEMEKMK